MDPPAQTFRPIAQSEVDSVLQVGDPIIRVIGFEYDSVGDFYLYIFEVIAPNGNKGVIKRRFSDILRDLHHQIGRPLGLPGPSRHLYDSLLASNSKEFVQARAKEIDIYVRSLMKTPGVICSQSFINFFQLYTLEDKETLKKREIREAAKLKAKQKGVEFNVVEQRVYNAQEPSSGTSSKRNSRQPTTPAQPISQELKEATSPAGSFTSGSQTGKRKTGGTPLVNNNLAPAWGL